MKAWRVSIKYRIAFVRCLFWGVFFSLLFPLNVRAEVDYGKEIIMVSMGDSYSSGEGIPPFYGPEDLEEKVKNEDWLAHRSTRSWPGQLQLKGLAQEMKEYRVDLKNKERSQDNIGKWYFVASSGAVTDNIFDEKQNKPYDKKKLKKDDNPMPLQAEIFQKINADEVDYITLTLGGNDVGFATIVESCAVNVGYSEPNGMPNLLIKAWNDFYEGENPIKEKLSNIYSELWKNIGEKGNIIVAGYPQLIDPEGGKVLYGLFDYKFDKTDAKLLNENVSAFNDAIERVVLDTQKNEGVNIYFVSVEDAFIGHGAYADEPYINKVVIPSKDEDLKKDKTSAYSMHPNETGARKYAGCVQETIDWIEAGKLPITVSGQVIDKNDQPVGDLTVVIETEKAKKEVFRGTTNESGEFSGDIKLTTQQLRIVVSNEEGFLIDTSVTKPIEYGNNELGKIKLDNYEGTMVVEIDDHESIDEAADQTKDEQEINSILNDFVRQRSAMYGKTCTFILTSVGEDNNTFEKRWEGLSEGMILGYSIEDFDNDESNELLLITLVDDYRLRLEMYEVVNEEVVLSDINNLDTGTAYGAVAFPCGSGSQQEICGRLSAFVNDSNHRIYLQSSDTTLIADGWETFIVSMEYRDNMFSDYKSSYEIGSSVEDGIPDRVQELLDMGVPNIDYDVYSRIFYNLEPLINCFGDGVHEIIHAEQYTTRVEKKGSRREKIVTETLFATEDGQISAPTAYSESNQVSTVRTVSTEDFTNGFWMSLDQLLAIFGEPDDNYTYRFQYIYDFENVECLGHNGKLSCRVGEDNMVYSVTWFSYEPSEDLFSSLINNTSESIEMMPDPYAAQPFQSYMGQDGQNRIYILYSEEEVQTSIQWQYI